MGTHMHIALVQSSGDNQHNVVNHVAIGAIVQELAQGLVRLIHTQRDRRLNFATLRFAICTSC